MKIKNYQYKVYIRNKKEPILLDRIESEALMLALVGSPQKFIALPIYANNQMARYFINTVDIVLIEPQVGWYQVSGKLIELSSKDEEVHKLYLEKVEKIQDLKVLSSGK